jgi:hypothetical protein
MDHMKAKEKIEEEG